MSKIYQEQDIIYNDFNELLKYYIKHKKHYKDIGTHGIFMSKDNLLRLKVEYDNHSQLSILKGKDKYDYLDRLYNNYYLHINFNEYQI